MSAGRRILVTGGAGFIGSALVRRLLAAGHEVLVLDKLTYAAVPGSLPDDVRLVRADIADADAVARALDGFRPQAIAHLAAETHVDRSIDGPAAFIQTNVVGAFVLLQQALRYWGGLPSAEAEAFRFHHVSTDEVFGSLGPTGRFDETTPYDPRSPYSASKAASDHLARAWGHTYGLPVLVSNCSNNYGPRQHPEKLIPLTLTRALACQPLPVYGDGLNVRDWLYVEDHALALEQVLLRGRPGQTYNVGGDAERTTIQVVEAVCAVLDRLRPRASGAAHRQAIVHVADRPGHDRRYAIDGAFIAESLGWRPGVAFEDGIERTVRWYLDHPEWVAAAGGAEATRRQGLG